MASVRFMLCLAVFWFAFAAAGCFGQGTVKITFDGYPPPGAAVYIPYYSESGVWFEPLPGSDGFIRGNGIGTTLWPDNGTDYLQGSAGDSLQFNFINNSVFDLIYVDLTGYSTVLPDFNVDFVGYKADGSTVMKNISGSGINFNTYYFDSRFTGLKRVEIPGFAWSLDNVVLTVPEPGQAKLLFLGAVVIWAVRRSQRRRARIRLRQG